MTLHFDDTELKLVIKSLSLTYDATSKRLDRLTGKLHSDALEEALVCDNALTKAKAEMQRRWQTQKDTSK